MGAVLTLAAAGSEMSDSCVLTNEEAGLKRGINGSHNRMTFAFMNPVNTVSVPAWQTAAGTVDIMIHTMERFLTDEEATPLTDNIAVGIMRRVIECGATLRDDPSDIAARADMMWASSLAHNDLTGCGRHKTFTAHKIEHDFSGLHDNITHGAGLSVIFPAWVMHEYKMGPERFAEWAVRIWDAEPGEDLEATIKDGVRRMRTFYKSLGMPVTIEELGITPDEYEKLADLTTSCGTKTLPSFGHALTKADIIDIYRLAEKAAVEA
jgi:alcohol dehydrogenase YqhD (iron-dependent ADH family)